MIQLVYHSVSVFHEDSPNLTYSLAVLIDECLHNNPALAITGVLAYRHGEFLQILEGHENTVDRMFERISADYRHTRIRMIVREPCTRRSFPTWAMGYVGHEYNLQELFVKAQATSAPRSAWIAEPLAQMLS